jgi:nucleotide-binding universal stress UspA family protein
MIATILVPVGGGETDRVVCESALLVAATLNAHLEFVHVRVRAPEAALHTPHIGFAVGGALRRALRELDRRGEDRAERASRIVRELCAARGIPMVDRPRESTMVSARCRQEDGDALERLLAHARHHDLHVMARTETSDGLPAKRLETLLLESGRPLLLIPPTCSIERLDTMMICWKETSSSVRAVSAAMPLLTKAKRVIVVNVIEEAGLPASSVGDVVNHLLWHGVAAECQIRSRNGESISEVLFHVAHEEKADLMIMGAYGHSPLREAIFGGCTRTAIEAAGIPILLMH